ncbi:MAG: hypothetical protein M1826_004867 [Phylliscum demangeonii]|nr:MAG: hypothetical protein M1826_004867 [Phylliscum demangeonii]
MAPSQDPPFESIIRGDHMAPILYGRHTQLETWSLSLMSERGGASSDKSTDRYISTLDEAIYYAKRQREESRCRQESRDW